LFNPSPEVLWMNDPETKDLVTKVHASMNKIIWNIVYHTFTPEIEKEEPTTVKWEDFDDDGNLIANNVTL
jgi:hypothetical protein